MSVARDAIREEGRPPAVASGPGALAAEILELSKVTRQLVAQTVNAGLATLYWPLATHR
jgi:hypothetical protein